MPDVRSEIRLVRRKIVSSGQSVWTYKKIYIGACQGPESQVLILHYTAVIVDNNFWYNNKVLAAAETN